MEASSEEEEWGSATERDLEDEGMTGTEVWGGREVESGRELTQACNAERKPRTKRKDKDFNGRVRT